jgi:hypothetical protein
MNYKNKIANVILGLILALSGCQKKVAEEESADLSLTAPSKKLYIATGQCNSGLGVTSFSTQNSSRRISKLDLATKNLSTFLDLTEAYVGGGFAINTGVQALVDNGSNILMLTENAVEMADRKIYSIPKSSPFNTEIYSTDPLALTQTAAHVTRDLAKDVDGTLLFSKSIGIEKIGTNNLRIPQGANPWVNAPAAPCATSITFMSSVKVLPPFTGSTNGKIVYTHAGATTALNRLGIINAEGYLIPSNCIAGVQISAIPHTYATNVTGPTPIVFNAVAGSSPTASVFIKTGNGPGVIGKLIVAYSAAVATETSNSVNLNYALVAWDVSETSLTVASLSAPVVLSRQLDAVFGISALAYDAETSSLYVATASQTGVMNQTTAGYGYKIEKFNYNLTTNEATLVREDDKPYLERTPGTKCITSMVLGNE